MLDILTILSVLGSSASHAAVAPPPAPYSAAAVDAAIEPHLGFVRECFNLHARPGSGGKLRLELELARDGHVIKARVERDSLHAPGAARCVRHDARHWQLPAPLVDGTRLDYTFVLR